MRTMTGLMAVMACLAFPTKALADPARAGSIQKRSYHFEAAGKDIDYALYVPRSYNKETPAPLLVLLHGLGSNPHQVIRYAGITTEAEERGYLVVAPYGYNERGWYGSRGKGKEGPFFGQKGDPDNLGELSEKDVLNVLGIVRKEFSIDPNRIYLMGHSMGGSGTMYLGATHPGTWAGLAPLSPALDQDLTLVEKLRDLPVMVVTGDQDRLVPVVNVRRWVDRMKDLEMDLLYKEIAGGNHFDSITRNPEMIAEVFDFFDQRRRNQDAPGRDKEFRTFTNQDGKKIRARPTAVIDKKVSIVREDGRAFQLPLESLVEEDRTFLRQWAEETDNE